MRLENPLIFNLAALFALTSVARKSPVLWALLQDMALGIALAVGIARFARQQAQSALPQDYD